MDHVHIEGQLTNADSGGRRFRQSSAPSFEVASVKVAAPTPPSKGGFKTTSGCRPNPGAVSCNNATLKMLLMFAYEVKDYQVEGPTWIETERYDLMAKLQEGVPAEQAPAMLQTLLTERFRVVPHKESKMLPAYDLVVAKSGSKMKEVDAAEVAAFAAGTAPTSYKPSTPNAMPPLGSFTMRRSANGASTEQGKETMAQLVNSLTRTVGRPVFDRTGLTGTYEVELSYTADGPTSEALGTPADSPIATIFQALDQSLGLKLEPRKAPVKLLAIQSASKVPTEN